MSAGYVDIQLDKPRRLKFDLEAIEDLEEATGGVPLGRLITDMGHLGVTKLRLALWAGLKHEDKALTPKLVRKMIQTHLDEGHDLKGIIDAVGEAIERSGLLSKDDDSGKPKPELTT